MVSKKTLPPFPWFFANDDKTYVNVESLSRWYSIDYAENVKEISEFHVAIMLRNIDSGAMKFLTQEEAEKTVSSNVWLGYKVKSGYEDVKIGCGRYHKQDLLAFQRLFNKLNLHEVSFYDQTVLKTVSKDKMQTLVDLL